MLFGRKLEDPEEAHVCTTKARANSTQKASVADPECEPRTVLLSAPLLTTVPRDVCFVFVFLLWLLFFPSRNHQTRCLLEVIQGC